MEYPESARNVTGTHEKRRRWRRAVSVLACAVVFCTTYALILPAITLSAERPGGRPGDRSRPGGGPGDRSRREPGGGRTRPRPHGRLLRAGPDLRKAGAHPHGCLLV